MSSDEHQWLMSTLKANIILMQKTPYGFSTPFRNMLDDLFGNLERAISVPEGVDQYGYAHDAEKLKRGHVTASDKKFLSTFGLYPTDIPESVEETIKNPTSYASERILHTDKTKSHWAAPSVFNTTWHQTYFETNGKFLTGEPEPIIVCEKHPHYSGTRTPRTGCKTCWDLYNQKKSLKEKQSQQSIAKVTKKPKKTVTKSLFTSIT